MAAAYSVKICGIRSIADARLACALGADHVGLIVGIARSPRAISPAAARWIRRQVGERAVVVTENQPIDYVLDLAATIAPGAIQLHGTEDPQYAQQLCAAFERTTAVWKAVALAHSSADREAAAASVLETIEAYACAGCERIVLDTAGPSGMGGTGVAGDWELAAAIVRASALPVMLAGGIGPDNVVEALRRVRPAGVDVSSRIERRAGIKDPLALRRLFAEVGRVRRMPAT